MIAIRAGLDKSPLYSGIIEWGGAKILPIYRRQGSTFAERERHQIFLEPRRT
jgi:tRNA uridine 5-carboxymethylaminomethyl modification enzyme